MIRVAIIEGLTTMAIVRTADWSLVVRPLLMHFDDALDWSRALYRPEESAVFRAYFGVSAANQGEGWRDALPGIVCGCHVPEPLRLGPWPACPIHDTDRPVRPIVESVELALGALSLEGGHGLA